ncbi:MAG: preprotein translocase subunit SecA [Candidatus Hydrogenedentota bacterium]
MIGTILKKIFGSKHERDIKRLQPVVQEVNRFEDEMVRLSDKELADKTREFKGRLHEKGETLEDILPEAFAVVREAGRRAINMRHFDVQIMGGVVLHQGKIAEMKTGEGKTLVATLPLYLNALLGKGVHLVTVNDYLAKRDTMWMGPVYDFLGMSVAVIQNRGISETESSFRLVKKEDKYILEPCTRKEAYQADITYGTNNEFGFDYLRDNMVPDLSLCVQRGHFYAIVDEVDSILIDEARTPLIISGPSEESTDKYYKINRVVPSLRKVSDFDVDEKMNAVMLHEEGIYKVERLLGVGNLYDPQNVALVHHVNQALRAHHLYKRDKDYIVKEGQVIIVDEFTGRLMPGRRFSDGLHQALEAKEGVRIQEENQTLATITFQNLFRMYEKLAGMTGTADTEAMEFMEIYGLDVVVIPTNKPMIRTDYSDRIYRTHKEKIEAIIEEICECYEKGRPVLVGTISIEKSEELSDHLRRRGVKHEVLNAKYHEKEAMIVAKAGQLKAVTIATNMAGRGTDIVLGEGVKELGGLHIIGTERHEARRIDNQLRGRSGRQGDEGSSRFYVGLDDDLMRLFGSDRIANMMQTFNWEYGMPIEHPWITKAIENAQKKVESHNFDIRKHLLEYDDVMNTQRTEVYRKRQEILSDEDNRGTILKLAEDVFEEEFEKYYHKVASPEEVDWKSFLKILKSIFGLEVIEESFEILKGHRHKLYEFYFGLIKDTYQRYIQELSIEESKFIERMILIQTLDALWKEHLYTLDSLREGIGLQAYGQKDPLVMYKTESSALYDEMWINFAYQVINNIFRVIRMRVDDREKKHREEEKRTEFPQRFEVKKQRFKGKIGRNEPCPCGSGKKYKKCCGR